VPRSPGRVLVTYCQTTLPPGVTSTMRLLFESVINVLPSSKRLANAAPLSFVLFGPP